MMSKLYFGAMPGYKMNFESRGVSIPIKGTEALRASLPIICEFDTLQNR